MRILVVYLAFLLLHLPFSYVWALEPLGCPEFDVCQPKSIGGVVVKAVDFGFSATNDENGAAITRALDHCRHVGASRLELAPGRYNCFSPFRGIVMAGLRDFTLDGKGARLVFRRPSDFRGQTQAENIPDGANLLVTNCLRTVVENLEMDWDWDNDPLADIGTVVATHLDSQPNASYFDLRLDCTHHPWYLKPMPIQTMTPVNATRDRLLSTAPNRLLFGLSEGHFGTHMTWLSPNCIRVWPGVKETNVNHAPHYEQYYGEAVNRRTVAAMKTGVVYRVFHYYYGKNGLYLHSNVDFTARNVRIYSCRGMGVVADGTQRRWQLVNVSIDPERDADGKPLRSVSCTSDGIHNARSCGQAKLIGCRVSYNNDDALNFHDIFTIVERRGPNTLEVVNGRGARYARYSPGETVELREENYNPIGWTGRLCSINGNTFIVDGPELPFPKGRLFLLFNKTYVSNGLILRNCVFEDAHYRTLIQPSNVTIEGCTFRRCGGALQFLSAYTKNAWCEGNGCTNVVVRNNLFEDFCNLNAKAPWISTGVKFPSKRDMGSDWNPTGTNPAFIGHFLVESNRFVNPPEKVFDFPFGTNFVIRNNTFVHSSPSEDLTTTLKAPVLDDGGYMSYATAYRRLAEADAEADEAWVTVTGTDDFARRCRDLRQRALNSFGGFPSRTPLNAKITGIVERPKYRIEKLLLESRPGFHVTAYVFTPVAERFTAPYPAVLVPCGHAEDGKDADSYRQAGVDLAENGFVGVVFDPVDQGERLQFPRRKTCGLGHNACGTLAVLIGESTLRIRLWDAIRLLDYLETRTDVDSKRIGVMGNSGGGTMTAMLMALDRRVQAAAPASYISNLRRVVDACGPQDSEQLLFGQLDWGLNHLGLLLLPSPMPVLVNASHDDFFPIDGTLETFRTLRCVTARNGSSDRYRLVESSGKHGWKPAMRSASLEWMRQWLKGERPASPFVASDFRLQDIAFPKRTIGANSRLATNELHVTVTGNVADEPGNRSVYRVLADDLTRIESARPCLSPSERAKLAVHAAGIRPMAIRRTKVVVVPPQKEDSPNVVRLGFVSPDGLTIPGVLFASDSYSGRPLLLAGDRRRTAFASDVRAACDAGRPVLVIDLEGYGEIGVTKRRIHVGSCVDDGLGKIHYLMGESLVGRRAEQILDAAEELKRRFGKSPDLLVEGLAAIPAAHAHAADPGLLPEVAIRNAPISWADAIRRAVFEPIQWTYTDSVQGALKIYDWPDLLTRKTN